MKTAYLKSHVRWMFALAAFVLLTAGVSGQALKQGGKPVKSVFPDAAEAYCSAFAGGSRLCKVLRADGQSTEFVLDKSGVKTAPVKASFWQNVTVEPDGFYAYSGDLDNDGRPETVVVELIGVSNGMGVSRSIVHILDGKEASANGRPLSFPIQEFGPSESFVYDPKEKQTRILLTYWADHDSIEPARGPGLYLVGKWFRYENGYLKPVLEQPTLARRFLNSFANERNNADFEDRKPYTWLKDRRTLKFFREPADKSRLVNAQTASITRFQQIQPGDTDGALIEFSTEDGKILKGRFNGAFAAEEKDGQTLEIKAIGLWKQRYLFPLSYSDEFDLSNFMDQINGQKVRIENYVSEYGDKFSKVWLLD